MIKRSLLAVRAILLLSLLVLCGASAPGQSSKTERRLFWKIASPTNELYLFGSIHLASKKMYPIPKAIEDAFSSCPVLVVEINETQDDKRFITRFVQNNGVYAGRDTIWKHVSRNTGQALRKFCVRFGMPTEVIAKMRPWMASTVVGILPLQEAGMDASLGIDDYFIRKAEKGKKIVQLETTSSQMHLFFDIPEPLIVRFLAASLRQVSEAKNPGRDWEEAWLSGDASRFQKLVDSSFKDQPEVRRMMLHDRNLKMAAAIDKVLKGSERSFVVVGAAHVVGEDGLVRLLQKRGYSVVQQ